jgi:hypothetical protein
VKERDNSTAVIVFGGTLTTLDTRYEARVQRGLTSRTRLWRRDTSLDGAGGNVKTRG